MQTHRDCYDNALGGREGSADISKKPPKKEAEHRKPAGLHHATSPLRQRPGTTSGHHTPARPARRAAQPGHCIIHLLLPKTSALKLQLCHWVSLGRAGSPPAPSSGMLPLLLGWHKGSLPGGWQGAARDRNHIPLVWSEDVPMQRYYCSQTPKSILLGHPGPELLPGHGGAERCRCCSPCWHAAGHQPRGETRVHGETCPPRQTHRRWLSPCPRSSSDSPAPQSPPPSAATQLGGQGPPTARGCVQALLHVPKPTLAPWQGGCGRRGATS